MSWRTMWRKEGKKPFGMNLGGTVQRTDLAVTWGGQAPSGAQDESGTHYVGVSGGRYVLSVADGPVSISCRDTRSSPICS